MNKYMMVNLSVNERYALARRQPVKGNFVTMTMTKNLIALLELTPDEAEAWCFKSPKKGVWVPDDEAAFEQMADIAFLPRQFDMIGEQLKADSEAAALEYIHIRLYEIFVRDPERADEDWAMSDGRAQREALESDDQPTPLRAGG